MKMLSAMLFLLPSLLPSLQLRAEVYKCVNDGHTIFTDKPCGAHAEVIDVNATRKKTGAKFADEKMEALGRELGQEREQAELERDISRLEQELVTSKEKNSQHMADLESRLADHANNADPDDWKHHEYKRKRFYEVKQKLKNRIKHTRREHNTSRSNLSKKLTSLKKERTRLR